MQNSKYKGNILILRGGTLAGDSTARFHSLLAHKPVDELPGDADLARDVGQLVGGEPAGLQNLLAVHPDLALGVAGGEADHQRIRKRPGLAAKIADILDLDAGLFPHLPGHRFFQGLALVRKSRPGRCKNLL